jgi:hypothetical protein
VNNVDYNEEDAAKAAARAHGVPLWLLHNDTSASDETEARVPTWVAARPAEKLFGCVWLSCKERFDTAEEAEAHVAEHDKRLGYKPYVYCCEECDYNDAREATGLTDAEIDDTRPSTNGGCS